MTRIIYLFKNINTRYEAEEHAWEHYPDMNPHMRSINCFRADGKDKTVEIRSINSATGLKGLKADMLYVPENLGVDIGELLIIVRGDSTKISYY